MFNNTTRFLYRPLKQDGICSSEMMRMLCHKAEGTICKEKASDFLYLVQSVRTLVAWPCAASKVNLVREWEEEEEGEGND